MLPHLIQVGRTKWIKNATPPDTGGEDKMDKNATPDGEDKIDKKNGNQIYLVRCERGKFGVCRGMRGIP